MKRQKECFIGVSAVVHLFLKIAGAMPVVFLLFLVVNVLHGTAWALETLARQVFFDGLQSAVERNSLQAAYSGALWVGAAAVYVQVLNGAGNFIGQHIFNPRAVNTLTREFHTQTAQFATCSATPSSSAPGMILCDSFADCCSHSSCISCLGPVCNNNLIHF